MMVKKALINDEISEKKAGLLLYSIQIAAGNVKNTTFTDTDKTVLTEMPEEEAISAWPLAISEGQDNTHGETGSGDLEIGGSGERKSETQHGETGSDDRVDM